MEKESKETQIYLTKSRVGPDRELKDLLLATGKNLCCAELFFFLFFYSKKDAGFIAKFFFLFLALIYVVIYKYMKVLVLY